MQAFVGGRRPIRKIFKDEIPPSQELIQEICGNFDMYRVINSSFLRPAAVFAYFQHLLRLTTPEEELTNYVEKLDWKMKKVLNQAYEMKNQYLAQSFSYLQMKCGENQLIETPNPNIHIFFYSLEEEPFQIKQFYSEIPGKTPICYIFGISDKQIILYTPTMSYLDGFDPFSAKTKKPLVPVSFMNKARQQLYIFSAKIETRGENLTKQGDQEVQRMIETANRLEQLEDSRGKAVFSPIDFIHSPSTNLIPNMEVSETSDSEVPSDSESSPPKQLLLLPPRRPRPSVQDLQGSRNCCSNEKCILL